MNVHLFGDVSSPGVANFGLRATAETGREQFGQAAADFLQQDFYVDDGLKSFPTPGDAIDKPLFQAQTLMRTIRFSLLMN